MPLILCARVPWPVTAVRIDGAGTYRRELPAVEVGEASYPCSVSPWRCSHCGARVKVVA